MAKKNFYITTSIAYTNAPPHIGFALESIQADVLARYHRQKGDEVFFLTGTDEHGTKNFRTAQEAGKKPQDFVNSIAKEYKALKKFLNLSFNYFIRTTDKKNHWPGVYKIWEELNKNGKIYKKKYKGFYCVGCENFVTGKDLVDGKCPIHLKKPEIVEEENYFFKLSEYAKKIEASIKNDKFRIVPVSRKNEVLSFLKEGLRDISISRSKEKLPWGIPVPGDNSQVIYVWIDALPNYLTGIGYGLKNGKKFKKFWPADIHVIGKDILRFHAVIWPALLLALKLPLFKNIFVHGFVTVEGQKMSKSLGNVISPNDLVKEYGIDSVRFYFLREIPSSEDGDFSYVKFKERYNGDLANGLGNFTSRVLTLVSRFKKLPFPKANKEIKGKIAQTEKEIDEKMKEFKIHEALASLWGLIKFGDNYVNQTKPWENTENKKEELANLVIILSAVANFLQPFLPQASKEISKNIRISKKSISAKKAKILFPRIN